MDIFYIKYYIYILYIICRILYIHILYNYIYLYIFLYEKFLLSKLSIDFTSYILVVSYVRKALL